MDRSRRTPQSLSLSVIYKQLLKRKASNNLLDSQGYPRPSTTAGNAEFRNAMPKFNKGDNKICFRCKKYFIQKNSQIPEGGRCNYHYGRCFDDLWNCCYGLRESSGCKESETHVHRDNEANTEGYVRTTRKQNQSHSDAGVYAVDCQMSYTVDGLELTRVSIVDHECRIVYASYVKPKGKILSYNTEHSGVTEKDLEGVTTTLKDVQNFMLGKFSEDTILIGHSLETDFIALRLIHETVVDTSLVFPHDKGLPVKRSLKGLAKDNLEVKIQKPADSVQHATVCMRLLLKQISQQSFTK